MATDKKLEICTEKNLLKPWLKSKLTKSVECCNLMLRSKPLIDLYKCMGNSCSFTTNEGAVMESHLNTHGQSRDALVCAYCMFSAIAQPHLLVAHIDNSHGKSRYQCRFCFYRAIDAGIIVHHQYFHHNEIESKKHSIIVLSSVRRDISLANEVFTTFLRRRKSLTCQACNSTAVSISLFAAHVKTHGEKETECPICSAMVDIRMIQVHLMNHRMDHFECVFCNSAYSSKLQMLRHLCDMHQMKADVCCMKMKRCNKSHDVYVIEKFTSVVRDDRLVTDTLVMDSPTFEADKPLRRANIFPVANGTEQTDLPKIVKVEGGIRMTADGKITETIRDNRVRELGCNLTAPLSHAHPSPSAPPSLYNSIRVKDFRFIKMYKNDNGPAPRKRVKLTKLADGSMVLKLPTSTSIPTTTTAIREPKLGAIVPAVFGMHKTEDSPRDAQLVHDEQIASNNRSVAKSIVTDLSHEILPAVCNTGFIMKPTIALTSFISLRENQPEACNAIGGGVNDDEDDDDDDWDEDGDGYNENAGSLNESQSADRNIRFHLSGYEQKIDGYASALEKLVLFRPFSGIDIFVCGTLGCTARFPLANDLLVHARICCIFPDADPIVCKHCKLVVKGVDSYVMHLNIHRLENFVCFLCPYNHFLLRSVVEHMKAAHKCNALRISFAHPQKNNLLKDVIVVIPVGLCPADMESNIDRTISEAAKRKSVPRQVHPTVLYKCGFCTEEIFTNKTCFKKHVLLCARTIDKHYPCAHCGLLFFNWRHKMDLIVHHLFFHGENLYQCSSCAYTHFQHSNVLNHVAKPCGNQGSVVITVRKSKITWKCHMCFYRSFFKQGVMEHVQSSHNLPGERYLCSVCDSRMFTTSQMETHCLERHRGEKVTVIEMYHPTSTINDDTRCPRIDKEQLVIVPANRIHILNVSQINAKHKESQMVRENTDEYSSRIDVPAALESTSKMADCNVQYPLSENNGKRKVNELTEAELDPQTNEEQNTSITEDVIHLHSAFDEDTDITQNREECVSLQKASLEDGAFHTLLADVDEIRVGGNESSIVDLNGNIESSTALNETHNVTSTGEKLSSSSTKNCSIDSSETTSILLPTSSESALRLSSRRASKRVAAKSDASYRFQENFKYFCESCSVCFLTFSDLETHASNKLEEDGHDGTCRRIGNPLNFRLLALVRCFYCNAQETCATLRRHCREDHSSKQFVCVDRLDMFKCGLCWYRNGSGSEKEFWHHFKCFHATSCSKFTHYEHINDAFLDWALTLGRKMQQNGNRPELKPIHYLCAHCKEVNPCEASMGLHVAKHWLTFTCPQCPQKFKHLKGVYYHVLAIHRIEDMALPPTYANKYDEHLLDVLMVFANGLILSKREAQHTSVALLEPLKAGFETYYKEQLESVDSYKEALLLPLLTECEDLDVNAVDTCKRFIQTQHVHLAVTLELLKGVYREELEDP